VRLAEDTHAAASEDIAQGSRFSNVTRHSNSSPPFVALFRNSQIPSPSVRISKTS
jgi:hypothetical protein